MNKLFRILMWQWTFFALAGVVLIVFFSKGAITGYSVSATEDTKNFAPPYDTFSGKRIITLTHTQIDEDNFNVDINIDQSTSRIYKNIYYYTTSGWQRVTLGGSDWIVDATNVNIQEQYSNFNQSEGDDFYVGVWLCKGINDEWKCGCKDPSDCGYWHIQSIDLSTEGSIPPQCSDADSDGFGNPASNECLYAQEDCDDTNVNINPTATEIPYNGLNDDCDIATLDDDLDVDGYLLVDDCDDTNSGISPSGTEICEDGIDQDCSGSDLICGQCGEGSIPGTGCSCEGSAYYTGYCCDNIYQTTPCGTPAVLFYDGFESGTANTWDYLNPHSQVNRDLPHSGQYSLDLIYTPGSGQLKKKQTAHTDIAPARHLFYKWNIYMEEDFIQPVEGVTLAWLGTNDWGFEPRLRRWQGDQKTGKLYVKTQENEYQTTATVINGQWYCLEAEVFTNTEGSSNGFIRVWVDDLLVFEQTGLTIGDGNQIDFLEQGGLYDGDYGDNSIHSYVDDVVVSTESIGCS